MEPLAGGGRHCERCSCRVNNLGELSEAEVEGLVARAGSERVCLRSELVGGRPRLAAGLAASLMVATLAGCATTLAPVGVSSEVPWSELGVAEGEGAISGEVHDPRGDPVANAVVVLHSEVLPELLEVMTNDRGLYAFPDLPPGDYSVQVLAGTVNSSKKLSLPEGSRHRANFELDPYEGVMGVLVYVEERRMMDASSTYHSSMVWIDED